MIIGNGSVIILLFPPLAQQQQLHLETCAICMKNKNAFSRL
jgi:hypothetical protein